MRPGDIDTTALARVGRELLVAIGEDPDREGLRETPRRWAKWWAEFLGDGEWRATTFDAVAVDQVIALSGIRVWSLCEHHLLPFVCDLTVGYLASKQLVGVSKLARACQRAAARLQVQERLAEMVADQVAEMAGAQDVAVVARGIHLCMMMRGARAPGVMHTSVMRGRFRHDVALRQEFLAIVPQGVAPLAGIGG